MKNKLVMVDFWSVCDLNGKPLGHGLKVGNEYYNYIKDFFDVTQYVNEDMINLLNNSGVVSFKHSLRYGLKKIKRVLHNFMCLNEVYKKESESLIWFYVTDMYLFLFILVMPKGKRKIVVNVYEEYLTSKVKHWILKRALKKIDAVFVTNSELMKDIPQGVLIPDYAYNAGYYSQFKIKERKKQAVCLGTMNEKKQLKEMVEVFSGIGYPLYVAGQFSSEDLYNSLMEIKSDNIIIENRFVEDGEYYKLLSESEYCVIPYDAEFYKNRTSGVIQECLFCDTVPIAPKTILKFSGIKGIGYNKLYDLISVDLNSKEIEGYREEYELQRNAYYNKDAIKKRVSDVLLKFCSVESIRLK